MGRVSVLYLFFSISILGFGQSSNEKTLNKDDSLIKEDTSNLLSTSTPKFLETPEVIDKRESLEDSLRELSELVTKDKKIDASANAKRKLFYQIGNLQRLLGKYQEAVGSFEKALKLAVDNKDIQLEASVLNSLGGLYYEIGEYKQGLDYCNQALEIYQKHFPNKKGEQSLLLANIGNIYLVLEDYHQAIETLDAANEINRSVQNDYYSSLIFSGLGYANFKLEIYDKANVYFQKGLKSAKKSGDLASEVANLANLGDLWLQQEDYDKADSFIYEAYNIAEGLDEIHIQKEVLELLIKFHEKKDEFDRAFYYQKAFSDMKDSLFSVNLNNRLAQASINIDNIQKEKEILELTVENERKEFQLRRTRYIVLFSGVTLLLVIILLFAFIQRNRFKNKVKLNELENRMIRLQMKPHFIFNVLSSIQSFMTKNDPIKASAYLSKFARLIRNVLNASRTNFTSLAHEAKMLKFYLELQQLRFDHNFDYDFTIDDKVDQDKVLIPPLIVQPIVENAIEHGLKNIDYQGKLDITFVLLSKNRIKIVISDNGIGLKNVAEKDKSEKTKKSVSTEVIKQQITLFEEQYKTDFSFNFYSKEGEKGTKVELIIPCKSL